MLPLLPMALVLSLWVRRGGGVCAPDCSGVESGTSVRDPTDCTRYYVCLDLGDGEPLPSEYPVECPSGQYFNDAHTVPRCDPISGAPQGFCSNLCNPCKPHCIADGGVTPHPTDCSTYYVCLQEGIMEVGCESNLPFFDYMTGECSDDPTLCFAYCDPCIPHCTAANERVPDPIDCHQFYVCNPPEVVSFLCPHNEIFNRDSGECEANAPCVIDCPDTTDMPLF
ncbi:uncharacterized protein [Panulirus ornatus]|uniref:uncharacterized protein n=1 Tax=Panulirus ornatus TaxID=150431 RepID=UPI003A85881C